MITTNAYGVGIHLDAGPYKLHNLWATHGIVFVELDPTLYIAIDGPASLTPLIEQLTAVANFTEPSAPSK